MGNIGTLKWNSYKKIINSIRDDFNKETVIWLSHAPTVVSEFNEEKEETYTLIPLDCLVGYNYFRTWPITKHKESGNLDDQNLVILLNVDYLVGLGHTTPDRYFDFQPEKDLFKLKGIIYRGEGDTHLAQASDEPLLQQIILTREETNTGDIKFEK